MSDPNYITPEGALVGEDQVDPAEGRIAWRSTLGRALLKTRDRDVATVRWPAVEIEVTLVTVRY